MQNVLTPNLSCRSKATLMIERRILTIWQKEGAYGGPDEQVVVAAAQRDIGSRFHGNEGRETVDSGFRRNDGKWHWIPAFVEMTVIVVAATRDAFPLAGCSSLRAYPAPSRQAVLPQSSA